MNGLADLSRTYYIQCLPGFWWLDVNLIPNIWWAFEDSAANRSIE